MYQKNRTRKNGDVWTTYVYRGTDGIDIQLGKDLDQARLKWAELEAKDKPADLTTMRSIFDRYAKDIIPKKAERTQKDNAKELKQLRMVFDSAPIDAITPSMIASYRDNRSAKIRANRELALFSHVFNKAREWGLTRLENPCKGVGKNKETPRDYYANDTVWLSVYDQAPQELQDAMDLAYLSGQRPSDVLAMRKDDMVNGFLTVQQGKTKKRLRIKLNLGAERNTLGLLLDSIILRNAGHPSPYFILNKQGLRVSWQMLRNRWDAARLLAADKARKAGSEDMAQRIMEFQFRDIRPKAASEIDDIGEASLLLGHSKEGITERVYRRIGAIASPTK
jgi:integrase